MEQGLSRAESQAAVDAQNWKLLGYFNYYRSAIALAAVGIGFLTSGVPPFGERLPDLFRYAGLLYAALATGAWFTIRARRFDFESHAVVSAFADIVLLTILMHASGGLSSGLGMLLVIAVAGTGLMLARRITLFYAALATVAVILEHGWDYLTGHAATLAAIAPDYPQVGMLGLGFFATAFLGYTLASRLRATEQLAERRGVDLANLTQLNELVIQRLQIGVLVCDADGNIRLLNQAAQRFLGLTPPPAGLPNVSTAAPDLAIQLFRWLGDDAKDGGGRTTPGAVAGGRHGRSAFATRAGYRLLPRFAALGNDADSGVLVFLEDTAVLKRQAQQMKMESLARLTASIAHEIRNPLGAISNAAQLLGEAANQNADDPRGGTGRAASGTAAEEKRLVKIIDDQSRRMNVIVENVTQLSRRDHVNPARLDLGPWLREFVRQYAETVQLPPGIFTLAGAEDLEICIDPEQLHQVVSNLCQNALRHSPPYTGTPLIKLDTGLDGEGRPYLDVIDWGKGVAPEIVDFIFDPFFTTTPKGTGLGLYIARELCEGNGAALDYHPGEGGVGSRFRITLARVDDCPEAPAA